MNTIIGISGKYGSGKDTIYKLIAEKYPQYSQVTFAHNVKLIVSILTGTTVDANISREGKASIPDNFTETLGRYQQIVGEGLRKLICDDVWIKSTLTKTNKYIVITDVRYINEAEAIEKLGGIVIRVERTCRKDDGRDQNHQSEVDLDNYNFRYKISNNGDIEDLREKVYEIIEKK